MNGSKISSQARTWIGTNFKHQGRVKKSPKSKGGVDCIGLIVGLARELNLKNENGVQLHKFDVTGYSREPNGKLLKENFDKYLEEASEIEEGNVLLFKFVKFPQHVGIVGVHSSGEYSVIHSYLPTGKVCEHILTDKWKDNIVGVYKFKGSEV